MGSKHPGMPRPAALTLSKLELLKQLETVDHSESARQRVLDMETDFRKRIDTHIAGLPTADATFDKFNTSPFVLLIQANKEKYAHVSQIEEDLLPAKIFSSMETSAGRMVEQVVLPAYGWTPHVSQMHSEGSLIDGTCHSDGTFRVATL